MSVNALTRNNQPDLTKIAEMATNVINTVVDWDAATGSRKKSLQQAITNKLDALLGNALKYDSGFEEHEALAIFEHHTKITDSNELGKLNAGLIALVIIRELSSTYRAVIERSSMHHWQAFEQRYIHAVC